MALILLACAGLQGLAAAADFLLVFLSVEVASVCFYILTGFLTPDPRAQEAALKYFILGSLASAVMVLGLALIGGSSPQVLGFRMAPGADPALYLPGCGALLIGLFFKVGAAPFHWWAPDAYQAAPPAAAGFMSVAPKIAAGAALLRWAERGLDGAQQGPVLAAVAAVAVVSITVGNLGALLQEEFRRFLAFSSVAHAGFLLLAPLAPAGRGWNALVLYGAAYAAMNLGSFAVAGILERRGLEGAPDGRRIENLNGLIHVSPVLGLALSVLLGSLIGIPFTAGFLGKLGLFQAAWAGGWTATVVYAAVQTVFAAGYYLRPLAGILVEPPHRAPGRFPDGEGGALAALGLCVAATLALGCFPDILLRFVP
jgi:NADH-quinone oxidoreductase subunit N